MHVVVGVFRVGRVRVRAYQVGLCGPEDMAGHLGLGVVRLALEQIGEVGEVVAVVDEAGDELRLVLKDEHRGVAAAGRDAADEGRVEDQLHLPGLHHGAAVPSLPAPPDLRHQPRQHGQRGAAVQARPAHVGEGEARRAAAPLLLHGPPGVLADSG